MAQGGAPQAPPPTPPPASRSFRPRAGPSAGSGRTRGAHPPARAGGARPREMAPKRKRGAGPAAGAAAASPPSRAEKRPRPAARSLWKAGARAPSTPLDPRLADRDPKEFLRRLLAPLEPAEFMRSHWAKNAVAIEGPPSRVRPILCYAILYCIIIYYNTILYYTILHQVRPILRDFLHDLDLVGLLKDI